MIDVLNHILLEVYCLKETDFNSDKPLPEYCSAQNQPSYKCLQNKCPFLDFTSCENALCYINKKSEAESIIMFGGEMEIVGDNTQNLGLWKNISIDAIDKSYKKYMQEKQN